MLNCIFCKIINKEIPCTKIYEDENFLAFLDINPLSPGHTQIIPKKHYRWVWDIENIGEYFEVVKKKRRRPTTTAKKSHMRIYGYGLRYLEIQKILK